MTMLHWRCCTGLNNSHRSSSDRSYNDTLSAKFDTLGLDFNDAVRRSMRRPNCPMLFRCLIDSKSTHKLSCMHASAFLEGLVPC